jgi:hypothetical protein
LVSALRRFAGLRADPVEAWKSEALARLTDAAGAPLHPRIEITTNFGFALLCIASGLPSGTGGPWAACIGLFSVLVVERLPRAALAQSWGMSSRVVIAGDEGDFDTLGVKARGLRAVALALVGPLASMTFAVLLHSLARDGLAAAPALALDRLALWHGVWGAAQLLPLVPFRVGRALELSMRAPFGMIHRALSLKVVLLVGLVCVKVFPEFFPLVTLTVAGAAGDFVRGCREAFDERDDVGGIAVRAEEHLAEDETLQALTLARHGLARARSEPFRSRLWKTVAWAAIGRGDALIAREAVSALPPKERDVYLVSSYLSACNRTDEALALLERARARGQQARETTKLLLALLVRRGDLRNGRRVALEDLDLLTEDEVRLVRQVVLTPSDTMPV